MVLDQTEYIFSNHKLQISDKPNPDSTASLALLWVDFEFPPRATTCVTAPSRHGARSSTLFARRQRYRIGPTQRSRAGPTPFSPPDQRSTGAQLQDPVWLSVGFSHLA